MRKRIPALWVPGLVVALGVAASTHAQVNPRQQATGRFDATAPAVGQPMPDVAIYNANAERLRLGDLLQGHYTVIVLGCLT